MEKCRTCKSEVKKGIRRCPYCGMLNPTLHINDVYKGIVLVLVVMGIYTYIIK